MSSHQVIIRVLPIDAEITPDLLRPQDIDPRPPLYKETHLVGNSEIGFCAVETTFCQERVHADSSNLDSVLAAECEAIPGLVKMKKQDLPRPVIPRPSKKKRRRSRKSITGSSVTGSSMQPTSPEAFVITSSVAESPMDLISPHGSIIKVEPLILLDGTLGGYNVKIPDKLSLNNIPGFSGTPSFNLNSENGKKQQTKENPDQNPSAGASSSKSKFCESSGMQFDASDHIDVHQYMYNEGRHFCDICFQKCKGMSDLFRHRKIHDK
ncbi:hypothetical protein CDAR_126701 [Caerostris darwini]|uniref:C2H2-type domain-containing protein n=1 Tax=Caerostris darwini TaxID=1538125 RepID=A0AAV4PK72_9ARAC|nr:hypothetical protein CDAR_126701 [Caerostris darwini]